jgi:hypothetical protein
MPKTVLLDEWHVTFRFPASLPEAEVRAIRRVSADQAFTAAVRWAVMVEMNKRPALKPARVMITR